MSVEATTAVWSHSQHTNSKLLMLLAIADFADIHGNAWGYMDKFCEKCRVQPRTARLLISELRQSRELEVFDAQGPRGSNLFRICIMDGPITKTAAAEEPPEPAPIPGTFKVPPAWKTWCAIQTPALLPRLDDVARAFAQQITPGKEPTTEEWRKFCKAAVRHPVAA